MGLGQINDYVLETIYSMYSSDVQQKVVHNKLVQFYFIGVKP